MEHRFWHQRWEAGAIGFHNAQVHPLLEQYWPALDLNSGRVFVPLCGKSLDMVWLADAGHDVVGCELSEIAVREFFAERGLEPTIRIESDLVHFESGPYRLIAGDFFALTPDELGPISAIYDRAALIALPAPARQRYVEHMNSLAPAGCPLLLVALEHDLGAGQGPPFDVRCPQVTKLFADWSGLQCLGSAPTDFKGHRALESCYRATR